MTTKITMPERFYIVEVLEDLYAGSAMIPHVAPRLAMHGGEVLDADGVARMLYEVSEEVAPLLAAIREDPLDKGDFEVIAGALCKGSGATFVTSVIDRIKEMQMLNQMFGAPSAKDH